MLETCRTFGILQIDPEPSLKALVAEISSEVGGLSVRHSPTGRKQAQGAVGTLLSNLYAQIRALKLDVEARYPGFDLSIMHPLFYGLLNMRSGYLIGMPKRVMDLLLLRNVGASPIVVHFVALLKLCTFARFSNSPGPFRHGKKEFGLAVTRSPTNTL